MKKVMGRIRGWRPPTKFERHAHMDERRHPFLCNNWDIPSIWRSVERLLCRIVRALLNLWCVCIGHVPVAIHEESICIRCEARLRVCTNCSQPHEDHVRGRCLYGFGKFTTAS